MTQTHADYEADQNAWLRSMSQLNEVDMSEAAVLFARCDKMTLVIENFPAAVSETGLRRKDLRESMESRMRSSRILSPERTSQYLYLNINGVGRAFSMTLELKRPLDTGYGFKYGASVWSSGGVSHNADENDLRGQANLHLDLFLNRYLRANQVACDYPERFPKPPATIAEASNVLQETLFPDEEAVERWIEYLRKDE